MNYVIPDGDYIVGPAKPAPEDPDDLATSDPFTILQGRKTSSFWAPYQGFWYLTLTDGATDGDMAPIITGTVTITKQADGNTLPFRFRPDRRHEQPDNGHLRGLDRTLCKRRADTRITGRRAANIATGSCRGSRSAMLRLPHFHSATPSVRAPRIRNGRSVPTAGQHGLGGMNHGRPAHTQMSKYYFARLISAKYR